MPTTQHANTRKTAPRTTARRQKQNAQNEIFPKARKAKIDLEELGIEMAERKKSLIEE